MVKSNQKRFPVYYNTDTATGKKIARWLSRQDNASDSVRWLIINESETKKEISELKEQIKILINSLDARGQVLTPAETKAIKTVENNIERFEERSNGISGGASYFFDDEE